nr:hypothetical protein [Tanacetum cinerariifolium]
MKTGFLDLGGRNNNRRKKKTNIDESKSDGNKEPISLTTKMSAIANQMIDGKLVFVGDDGLPLKPTHMKQSSSPHGFVLENENGTKQGKPPKSQQNSSLPRFKTGTVHPITPFPTILLSTTSPVFPSTPPPPHHSHDPLPPFPATTKNQEAIKRENGKTEIPTRSRIVDKDAHIGYNCPSTFPVSSNPEPCNNQTIDELPQALPIFHPTFRSEAESPFTLDSTPTYVDESPNNLEEKQLKEEQAAKAQTWKLPVCYDDDDDVEGYNSLNDNIIYELPPYSAVTPNEPVDSLSMGGEHLDTIPATESDEFIKSYVENLVPNPSESEGENGCDVPAGFTTFSNVLFDADYDSDSNQHSFNDESDLIESMPNHDSSVIISSKIDSLFDEFAGELTLFKSIPPRIDETDCHPEKEIRFAKRLLYDNSSPRPPKKIVSDNSNADIESFSPSPIPNEDSDPLMEEIDLSFNPDDPMPLGIKDDDYDSERDISILEESLDNYSLSLPANESYHFDIPSPYRPPAKPPDGNRGTLNIKMMGDVSHQKVPITGLMITRVLNQEKFPDLLSHPGLKAFQPSAECPMIINGKNTPVLDVPFFHFYPP